jgi:hypothetical protein
MKYILHIYGMDNKFHPMPLVPFSTWEHADELARKLRALWVLAIVVKLQE